MSWNDTHGWDTNDRRYNIPEGKGRITRDIKEFNGSQFNTISALRRVEEYIQEEQKQSKDKEGFEIGD